MNWTRIAASVGLSAVLAASAAAANAVSLRDMQANGVVRIAVANEVPYGYIDLDGQAKGIGPDVAKHLIKSLGIANIKWTATDFGSLINGLNEDRFDIVAAEMAVSPVRCRQILFSDPNSSYGEGLLVAKGNPRKIHSYESFIDSGLKVAILAGAAQHELLLALGVPSDQIVILDSNADAVAAVENGQTSAYAGSSLTIGHLGDKNDKVEVAANFIDPKIEGETVRRWGGFTFALNSEDLKNAVDAELKKFKTTDEWKNLMTRYGFTDADIKASSSKTAAQLCASR